MLPVFAMAYVHRQQAYQTDPLCIFPSKLEPADLESLADEEIISRYSLNTHMQTFGKHLLGIIESERTVDLLRFAAIDAFYALSKLHNQSEALL